MERDVGAELTEHLGYGLPSHKLQDRPQMARPAQEREGPMMGRCRLNVRRRPDWQFERTDQ